MQVAGAPWCMGSWPAWSPGLCWVKGQRSDESWQETERDTDTVGDRPLAGRHCCLLLHVLALRGSAGGRRWGAGGGPDVQELRGLLIRSAGLQRDGGGLLRAGEGVWALPTQRPSELGVRVQRQRGAAKRGRPAQGALSGLEFAS